MERIFAKRSILFLVGATTICMLALGTGQHALVHAETPDPCEILTPGEVAAVLEAPIDGDPVRIDVFGLRTCGWFGTNDNTMGIVLFSGPDDEADAFFDTTYNHEEEIGGIGDRAKWIATFEPPPWDAMHVRVAQYYVAVGVTKREIGEFDFPVRVDASDEILDTTVLVLSRLHPRAPVEFTQAIQELQENYELAQFLLVNGRPPVPIVAGKPAVARVYFDEVDEVEVRTVRLTDVAQAEATVTLMPGCTVEKQRRQEDDCKSADLYFTPPEGGWTATIIVRDGAGVQVDKMDFEITSVKTDLLKIMSIAVCDDQAGSVWQCSSTTDFAGLVPFLRATFPGDVQLLRRLAQVQRDVATNPASNWWSDVVDDVRDLWLGAGEPLDEYYYGAVRGTAGMGTAAGGTGGIAYRPGRAAASRTEALRTSMTGGQRDTAAEVVAHEVGHNIGRQHVPSPSASGCYNQPGNLDPGWPNGSSPFIEEVGFDVANRVAMPEDKHADWMTYCTPRWISIYTYKALINEFSAGAATAATTSGTPGSYWLVSGSIEGLTASFDPLIELETSAAGAGSGGYRIEVKDGGGGTLSTRLFTPAHVHSDEMAYPMSFAQLVPADPSAATITVHAPDNTLMGALTIEGAAPSVDVSLNGPSTAGAGDILTVGWEITDADSADHTAWVEFSKDGGATWEAIAVGIEDNQLSVDSGALPGTGQGMFRARVSDGVNTGVGVSELLALPAKVPEAAITFPKDSSDHDAGSLVWLQGFASDAEDGDLDAGVTWTSSIDGALGTGASLPVYDLSAGTHVVTLTARDADNNEVSDSITITVGGGPGTQLIWGDNNCSGSVDPVDGLLTLRFDAGLSTNTGECPALGVVVEVAAASPHAWGDVDCDGAVTPVDSLKLLRHDAGLPVNQEPQCPLIGSGVLVKP